ncbi:hypothetical protein PVA17_22075 [Lysinibacillus sp. CNPSo 3705]|uniref:hypothetical protein n=1 Tax=Lysinibacillus sp. CNPSo 3705 TaxID=3028148 RepID=UPI0023631F2E|nr:hypothetical protein [Lysinibacillus sp. CNPSo 3705]MDD1505411.1 hypothetical protein [Lysinibacillus sp. CNPSo 3705]
MRVSDTEEPLQNRGTKDKRIMSSDHAIGPTSRSFRTNKTPCCHFAFAQKKTSVVPLRFRTKTSVVVASLSHKAQKHLLLSLRFRTKHKTSVAVASLSHKVQKHLLLPFRFRTNTSVALSGDRTPAGKR